jgi:hypothetical protein
MGDKRNGRQGRADERNGRWGRGADKMRGRPGMKEVRLRTSHVYIKVSHFSSYQFSMV